MWWTDAVTESTSDTAPRSYTVHPRRGRKVLQTVRDMVFSLGAIGAAVAVILVITHRPLPDPIKVVDIAPVVAQAQSAVAWKVVAPDSTLVGWRATSARIEPATKLSAGPVVAFGFVTPHGQWFGVKQAGVVGPAAAVWVQSVLTAAGDVSVSAVQRDAKATYVVYGTGTDVQRRALQRALALQP